MTAQAPHDAVGCGWNGTGISHLNMQHSSSIWDERPPSAVLTMRASERRGAVPQTAPDHQQFVRSDAQTWRAWSAWPSHPAIQPPLPRMARSDPAHPANTQGASIVHIQEAPMRRDHQEPRDQRDQHEQHEQRGERALHMRRAGSGAPHANRANARGGSQLPSRPPISTFSAQSSLVSAPLSSALSLLNASAVRQAKPSEGVERPVSAQTPQAPSALVRTRLRAPYMPAPLANGRPDAAPVVRRFSVPAAQRPDAASAPTPRPLAAPHLRPHFGGASGVRRAPMRPQRLPSARFGARGGLAPQIILPPGMTMEQRAQAMKDFPPDLNWPPNFDDWMIDIVRRRALRLNGGARRRGSLGSVRAVDLALILQRSADAEGRWRCAICHQPLTLADLSFDHIVALADGGEHAAYNLAPTHRKCNEMKGSEKAQFREQARERWLSEWATAHSGAAPRATARRLPSSPTRPRRFA